MTAPDELVRCKELVGDCGFVDVDGATLQHKKYSNVFAIGDSSSSPNSKTAAAAGTKVFPKHKFIKIFKLHTTF